MRRMIHRKRFVFDGDHAHRMILRLDDRMIAKTAEMAKIARLKKTLKGEGFQFGFLGNFGICGNPRYPHSFFGPPREAFSWYSLAATFRIVSGTLLLCRNAFRS